MGVDQTGNDQQQDQPGGLQNIGAALAAAREKKQLNVDSVAADLNLRTAVLRALETGDETKLPAQAFVRGYIKSYARLVGLDERLLLAQLPQTSEQRGLPLKRVGMRRRRISLPIGKWLVRGLGLAAIMLVLVFAAPLVERLWSDKPPRQVSDELRIPQPGAAAQLEYLDIPAADNGAVEQPDPETPASVVTAPDNVADVVAPPARREAEPATTVGPAIVTLKFSQDSWVEMEAHGRKLVVGMQRAGSERTVTTEPPVAILLGNAPAVELTYRGKRVDLGTYQRGNVARVTLAD